MICSVLQLYGQKSTLQIYNYSSYYLEAVLEANGLSGNCFPKISLSDYSTNPLTIPPGSLSNPFIAVYPKYNLGPSSSVPVQQWLVQSSATNTPIVRQASHPSLNDTSIFTTATDWTECHMVTRDANFIYSDELEMGNPSYDQCNSHSYTYRLASVTEAEWFTITSGADKYTIVQVF